MGHRGIAATTLRHPAREAVPHGDSGILHDKGLNLGVLDSQKRPEAICSLQMYAVAWHASCKRMGNRGGFAMGTQCQCHCTALQSRQ
jgi:hypothetical protein